MKELGGLEAEDWMADHTGMSRINARLDPRNQRLINKLDDWFEHTWYRVPARANDPYRYKVTEELLGLCRSVSGLEPERWKGEEPANFALPRVYPERASAMVEMLGPAVVFEKPDGGTCTVVVAETREDSRLEALGETATYLDLMGIEPLRIEPPLSMSSRFPCTGPEALEVLHRTVKDTGRLKWDDSRRDRQAWLLASDFVWLWQEQGRLKLVGPEGEPIWGLWDCARHLLRKSLGALTTDREFLNNVQRTDLGRTVQKEIFRRLPLKPLAGCYWGRPDSEPAAFVILCPRPGDLISKPQLQEHPRHALLEAILAASRHPSNFWKRDAGGVQRSADELLETVDLERVPPVYRVDHGTGAPFGSIASLIRETVLPNLLASVARVASDGKL